MFWKEKIRHQELGDANLGPYHIRPTFRKRQPGQIRNSALGYVNASLCQCHFQSIPRTCDAGTAVWKMNNIIINIKINVGSRMSDCEMQTAHNADSFDVLNRIFTKNKYADSRNVVKSIFLTEQQRL